MNILTIAVILAASLIMARGFFRGFLKMLFSMCFFGLILLLTAALTPKVHHLLDTSVYVRTFAEEEIEDAVEAVGDGDLDDGDLAWTELLPVPEDSREAVAAAVSLLAGSLSESEEAKEAAVEYLADLVIYVSSGILTFLFSAVLLLIAELLLGKAVKLPVLGTVNRLLGLLLGAAKALLLIWLFLGVVSVLSYTGTGSFLYEQVEESALLSWLSRNNLFLQAMIRAGAEMLS